MTAPPGAPPTAQAAPSPAPPSAAPLSCDRHPDRPAVAHCMGCETSLCRGCDASWEGIHYCVRCLGERRGTGARQASWPGVLALLVAVALLLALVHLLRLVEARLLAGIF